jgi:hypothetical protein
LLKAQDKYDEAMSIYLTWHPSKNNVIKPLGNKSLEEK